MPVGSGLGVQIAPNQLSVPGDCPSPLILPLCALIHLSNCERTIIMGTFSIWHWLVVLAVVLVLFGGKGKISSLMGDFGKGLKSFKKGIKDDESIEDNKSEFSAESSVTDATEDQDKKTAEQA